MAKESNKLAASDDPDDGVPNIGSHFDEMDVEKREKVEDYLDWKPVDAKVDAELKKAATMLPKIEIMHLTTGFYGWQRCRMGALARSREAIKADRPDDVVVWLYKQQHRVEKTMVPVLGLCAASYRVGAWLQSIKGVGPIMSAAMLAYFDITRAPTVGHYWSYMGANPTRKWLGKEKAEKLIKKLRIGKELTDGQALAIEQASGQRLDVIIRTFNEGITITLKGKSKKYKGASGLQQLLARRPWNADLKSICFGRLGESFVKTQNTDRCPDAYYGPLFAKKKAELWKQNLAGEFVECATTTKEDLKHDDTRTYAWKDGQISVGDVKKALAKPTLKEVSAALGATNPRKGARGCIPMLPPGQIYNRARRWAVKLFISHMHHVQYEDYYEKTPPYPYAFEYPGKCGKHQHLLLPPNWPAKHSGRSMRDLMG